LPIAGEINAPQIVAHREHSEQRRDKKTNDLREEVLK
jgi:hypothetical protein